jgi:GT2 family glycosyltransferase
VTDPAPTGVLYRGSRVPDRPAVSVVVLVLDRVDLLHGCLATLAGSSSVPTEVVVVANGTDPADLSAVLARDDVVVVRSGVNLGFGGGCALGADVAVGEFLVFVNDDSRLDEGCVDRLVRRARTDATIGAVGSRIFAGDGTLQEAGGILWRDGSSAHVGRDRPAADRAYVVPRDVDYCSANGLLVRRSAWDAVGGFDEVYFPAYYEDADLCMALRGLGLRTVYEPTATLVHLETQSSTPDYRRFLMDRNRVTFRRRWADALAGHPDPPATDRRGAIDRRVGESRTLPALGDPTDDAPVGDAPATAAAGGAHVHDLASELERRERRATAGALEVKDAYIAALSAELRTSRAREEHATRFQRWFRTAGQRVRAAVPSSLKATVRSLRDRA